MLKNEINYSFVILHYLSFDMTVECVDMLLNSFSDHNIRVIIVDNASPNNSGKELYNKYNDKEMVDVILNKSNEGFAKGNNLGFDYARDNYNPDYIIVMNNDVLIDQLNFLDEIDNIYKRTEFAVLGPDIYNPAEDKHQNPAHLKGFTKEEAIKLHTSLQNYCKHPAYHYYKHLIFGGLKEKIKGKPQKEKIDFNKEQIGIVLHGACYIFSRDFINKREYCFCPETFLYMEEDILHYECIKARLKILYSPLLKVTHLEDVSTNLSIKSGYRRFKFKNLQMLNSINIFIDLL